MANRKVNLMAELRADVWDASDKHCAYCGEELHPLRTFCVDHVIPTCAGGTDDMTNLVAACRDCNRKKGYGEDKDMCQKLRPRARPGLVIREKRVRDQTLLSTRPEIPDD